MHRVARRKVRVSQVLKRTFGTAQFGDMRIERDGAMGDVARHFVALGVGLALARQP